MADSRPIANLENWACIYDEKDFFTPPENRNIFITGIINNHPRHKDGKKVITSRVIEIKNNTVYTKNSIYILGAPNKCWLNNIQDNGIEYDSNNPLKLQ